MGDVHRTAETPLFVRSASTSAQDRVTDRQPRVKSGTPGGRRFRHRPEFTRERDAFRHLYPWADTYRPVHLCRNPFSDQKLPVPELCPDTALAAFAQLCALRLHARRCMISLITSDTEFVLADMTRSMSLQYDALIENEKDHAWVGTCSFPRSAGVNSIALDEWRKATRVRETPSDQDHWYTDGVDQHWNIITDVRHNEQHRKLVFFRHTPSTRFCASVPLRGAQGSVIGSLIILDDEPRYGVHASDMAFLEDLSDTVVEHLDACIVRAARQRGERLIQGIGLFNSGKSSLRDWWLAQDDVRVLSTGRHANKGTMGQRQARVDAEFGVQKIPQALGAAEMNGGSMSLKQSKHAPAGTDSLDFETMGDSTDSKQLHTVEDDFDDVKKTSVARPKLTRQPTDKRKPNESFDLATASAEVYARASNLLREAIGAHGVAFINANAVVALANDDPSDSDAANTSDSGMTKSSSDKDGSDSGFEARKVCEVYSFTTRTEASNSSDATESESFTLPAQDFRRLMKRYPKGYVFHIDEKGVAHASSDETSGTSGGSGNERLAIKRKVHYKDGRVLSRAMKGARTVALYPLWDEKNDRWRSCIFAWSTSPDRYFDRGEDLTYLTAFGHSLLAELSRLESIAADKAKATFISSISHELRSPLHGIMAGVEFLQDTELTTFQDEMTHTIAMAGRTLLDTVNHVLDYSKISNHSRAQKKPSKGFDGRIESLPLSHDASADDMGVAYTDLGRLTEEVVETTVTAYQHAPLNPRTGHSQSKGRSGNHGANGTASRDFGKGDVSVTLNIDHREWMAKTQPGAWTRILTNLLGNALKYTFEGHIAVRLIAGGTDGGGRSCPVQLIVEDTGIGISEAFQSHGMFLPFSQQDPHATGTGLGLSIVKHIASAIGAKVDVISHQGVGTTVTVRMEVDFNAGPEGQTAASISGPLSMPVESLKVDRFHLLSSTLDEDVNDSTSVLIGRSVLELADQWLDASTCEGSEIPSTSGTSVCAIAEAHLLELQHSNPKVLGRMLHNAAQQHSHILVLGRTTQKLTTTAWSTEYPISPVFIHQPIGPRKLLRAIASDRDSYHRSRDNRRSSCVFPDDATGESPRLSARLKPSSPRNESPLHITPGQVPTSASREGTNTDSRTESVPSVLRSMQERSAQDDTVTPSSDSTPPAVTPGARSAASSNVWNDSAEADASHAEQGAGDTVLLVEDNDVNMKLLVALMKKLKLKYQCAANGREAVHLYRKNPAIFFLTLMDMSMPIMDGFAATSKIREFEKRSGLKKKIIVALTGVTSKDAQARAFDCGVDEYYPKPVRMQELKDLVDRVRN